MGLPFHRSVLDSMRSQIFAEFFDHHGFAVGPVAEVHLRNGITFEDDEVGADAVEEPAVMGDACKFFEGAQGIDANEKVTAAL